MTFLFIALFMLELIIYVQALAIVILVRMLVSKNKKEQSSATFVDSGDYGKDSLKVTYSWKLDSARKTKLKGHLMLQFNPEEIQEQREANPFAVISNRTTEQKLKEMYYYMLSHPRTMMHAAEVVKYVNRVCSQNGIGELDKLQFLLDFVQEPNVKYSYDNDCEEIRCQEEYVRFPDETLLDRRGDCDCKSFLAMLLFHIMGYNVLYLLSYKKQHAAVCIEYDQRWQPNLQNKKELEDVTLTHEGRKYVFCETTSDSFRIGGISEGLSVKDFEVRIELRG